MQNLRKCYYFFQVILILINFERISIKNNFGMPNNYNEKRQDLAS